MKERSKAELKQALEDFLEGEDGVSVNIVCSSFLDHPDLYKPTPEEFVNIYSKK